MSPSGASPGVTLTVRAYQERKGAELAVQLAQRDFDAAQRDYVVAQQGLEIAKQNLKDCRDEEEYISQTLTDWEQAEVLQEILRSEN